jgi:hypothetical protein
MVLRRPRGMLEECMHSDFKPTTDVESNIVSFEPRFVVCPPPPTDKTIAPT